MQILYYDGPSPPTGVFDDVSSIPSLSSNIDEGSFAISLVPSLNLDGLWLSVVLFVTDSD